MIFAAEQFVNAEEAHFLMMLLTGPDGRFLHNSKLSVFLHEIQRLINGCGATTVPWGVSKTDIS